MKTIRKPTGKVNVYNYPPIQKNTYSYITLEYKEIYDDNSGSKLIESDAIYFHSLSPEMKALAIIIGEAQLTLTYLFE
jgi:hypothetical protein